MIIDKHTDVFLIGVGTILERAEKKAKEKIIMDIEFSYGSCYGIDPDDTTLKTRYEDFISKELEPYIDCCLEVAKTLGDAGKELAKQYEDGLVTKRTFMMILSSMFNY